MKNLLLAVAVAGLALLPQGLSAQKKAKIDKRAGYMEVPWFQTHNDESVALTGHEFIQKVQDMGFWDMEEQTVAQILAGNVPSALKKFRKITYTVTIRHRYQSFTLEGFPDGPVKNETHKYKVEMWVLPDYLAVGNDQDFVRMPMGPLAAQRVADSLYCSLPTTFLSDRIDEVSEGRIEIFPFRPVGDRNMKPLCFEDSNNAINALMRSKGLKFGQFVSGLKKDVVLTTRLENEPDYYRHVAIYGWFHPDGHPQQPLFIRHGNFYSDYSHGIRLIYRTIKIDGKEYDLRAVLEDPFLFRLVSKEDVPFKRASYDWQKPWHFKGR
ncbi:MAG: hypothetical protein IJG54_03015 [Bacteroidales bacterium]|nr:hypothetical protein [Bacteroidales bacterium]